MDTGPLLPIPDVQVGLPSLVPGLTQSWSIGVFQTDYRDWYKQEPVTQTLNEAWSLEFGK